MYKRRMGDVLSFTEAKEERDRVLSELQRVHGRVKEHLATHGRVSRDLVTSFSDVAYMFPFWIRHEYPSHGALTLIGVLEWHLDQIIAAAS